MKRIIIAGIAMLCIGTGHTSLAQGSRQYDDDIYQSRPAQTQPADQTPAQPADDQQQTQNPDQQQQAQNPDQQGDGAPIYSSDGSYTRNYNDESNYNDYEGDYNYSSRISRFDHPFYNQPYWSAFYNPYWYDPFWVDPYWGYSPWARPGFSVSFGAGPYWSSYWGWQSWYGCGNFGSYYGYPGFYGGGFYNGYWNGYYAGLYGYGHGYHPYYRSVTYGPRYSLNGNNNPLIHRGFNGFRQAGPTQAGYSPQGSTPRAGQFRGTNASPQISRDGRNDNVFNSRGPQPGRQNGSAVQQQEQPRRERGGFFGRGDRSQAPSRVGEQPRQQSSFPQQSRNQGSMPSRGFGGGNGGRSFGGNGGGGGRSFGGGGGGRSGGGGGGHRR